ncbi:YqhR family membrane protein [Alkalicoccobacillus murimartini]|uniref:Membrane protein YagU involved in acid resistance n=1 Tax=Alkalicoccobacillus murimartini TaxID=171685 RepID=A0ABT9YPM0_9BACI|nr:YqhR family membrane protein [Alkalicoccobacillus murimartini]MDQ0208979.1 putative membrane protein YagU involved in acid resistance [Alkalicoccobacillus murimartini]
MDNQPFEQNQTEKPMRFHTKVILIGFFGGLIWSLVALFGYFFNFMHFGPALILMPWALGAWKVTYTGQVVGVVAISLLSIFIAFIYKWLFQKLQSMWAGVGFGALLWVLVFYIFNPFIPGLKAVQNLDLNSIITSLCLFLLYGLFVGYSISYEYQQQNQQETV